MPQTRTEPTFSQKISGFTGAVIWRYASILPHRIRWWLGGAVGSILYCLLRKRRKIVNRNLELCFPTHSKKHRNRIAVDCFKSAGRGVFAWGFAMFANAPRFNREVKWTGLDTLESFIQAKKSVILLCPHVVCALILFRAACDCAPATTIYKTPRNPIFDMIYKRCFENEESSYKWLNYMFRSNTKNIAKIVRFSENLRPLYRAMSNGALLFYLPDQNANDSAHQVFAPFFGIQCATYNGLSRIARFHNSRVFICYATHLPAGKGYEIYSKLLPKEFISGNLESDAVNMNKEIEHIVQRIPEQYFWLHRKFQTRPPGEEPLYSD